MLYALTLGDTAALVMEHFAVNVCISNYDVF